MARTGDGAAATGVQLASIGRLSLSGGGGLPGPIGGAPAGQQAQRVGVAAAGRDAAHDEDKALVGSQLHGLVVEGQRADDRVVDSLGAGLKTGNDSAWMPAGFRGWLETITPGGRKPMTGSNPRVAPDLVREHAAKLADLTDDVLFADVWERPGLSPRDRSLITVAALVALGRDAQLTGHLRRGLDNGLSRDELAEAITHLAFYAGWPAAMSAVSVLASVTGQDEKG
jgi:4-carboxymuconolactone decarboxylase